PMAAGASPAATAAPLPDEEPQVDCDRSYGLRVSPPTALQPELDCGERMFAHSERFALLMMIAPAARRRATRGASRSVSLSARASEPAVVGSSRVSILSLMRIGTPNRGATPPRNCGSQA